MTFCDCRRSTGLRCARRRPGPRLRAVVDALTTPARLRILERLEKVARRLPVPGASPRVMRSLLQPLSEKYCYGQQFPRMRPCQRSGNRNGRRHQLVEPPPTTPLLVVRDRSGWPCWLVVGKAPRRGPSTSGLYRFHCRPGAYRDRSRLGHQLGVRSSCGSSSASSAATLIASGTDTSASC